MQKIITVLQKMGYVKLAIQVAKTVTKEAELLLELQNLLTDNKLNAQQDVSIQIEDGTIDSDRCVFAVVDEDSGVHGRLEAHLKLLAWEE